MKQKRSKKPTRILLPLALLVMATVACTIPIGPATPQTGPEMVPTVVFTQEALTSFENKLNTLMDTASYGPVTITFTEEELGAVVCRELERAKAEGIEIPISEIGLALGDNQLRVSGKLEIPGINATGWVSIQPQIRADGLVDLQVASVEFGFIDFQPDVLNDLTDALERSINSFLVTSEYTVKLTAITITDSDITLSGTINP